MDPLSISAGIIAFLGASAKVVGFLEELSSLRNAPAAILALNNEIADLRMLFCGLEEIARQQTNSAVTTSNVKPTLDRAKQKVLQLETILEFQVIKRRSVNNEIEIDRITWLRNKKTVLKIHDEFRDMKLDITTALGTIAS
jgi:hypothetical protein